MSARDILSIGWFCLVGTEWKKPSVDANSTTLTSCWHLINLHCHPRYSYYPALTFDIHRSTVYLHNKMPDLLLLLLFSVVLAQRVKQIRSAWILTITMEGRRKKMSTGIPLKKDALKTLATDTPCPLSFPSCTPPTFGQQSWLDHSGLEQQAGNE